jgi:hypothetical protein
VRVAPVFGFRLLTGLGLATLIDRQVDELHALAARTGRALRLGRDRLGIRRACDLVHPVGDVARQGSTFERSLRRFAEAGSFGTLGHGYESRTSAREFEEVRCKDCGFELPVRA